MSLLDDLGTPEFSGAAAFMRSGSAPEGTTAAVDVRLPSRIAAVRWRRQAL